MPNATQDATSPESPSVTECPGSRHRIGLAIQGVGGAVATTIAAGLALLRRGRIDTTGLPLAGLLARDPSAFKPSQLADYSDLVIAGWDICGDDLYTAAVQHAVLPPEMLRAVERELSTILPWRAMANNQFSSVNVRSDNQSSAATHRERIAQVNADLAAFKRDAQLDAVVVVNLSSTEAPPPSTTCLDNADTLEQALDISDERISASVLYAYAAIDSGIPHVNFTPTRTTDWPAMLELAERRGVPVCGKDGRTGQTLLKTVLAPAFRDRNLRVEGWFSTNLLGNRDGEVLADPLAVQSKLATKSDVLETIVGYRVADHQVHIHYYRPRGDAKEAWDSIDLVGFAGQRMQVKVNFLCRDSILAAPLVIELARLIHLAQRRGERGPIDPLAVFFKSLITSSDHKCMDFSAQEVRFESWLRRKTDTT